MRIIRRMAKTQISISKVLGFGWTDQRAPATEPDGGNSFTYRYIPPGFWNQDLQIVRAYMNAASKLFPTFEEFPASLLPTTPSEGAENLTTSGKAFYESCPTYAKLTLKEPWMTWEQHHPKGGMPWQIRVNGWEPLADIILRDWPISDWAKAFLEPWKDYLPLHAERGPIALFMQTPLPRDAPPKVKEDGWSEGLDNLRIDVAERVEYPWGPMKVLLRSCEEGSVRRCKDMNFSDSFKLMPVSLGYRTTRTEPFMWREHHVFRIEAPMQMIPRAIKWLDDNEMGHPGSWSLKSISPCYEWDVPFINYQVKEENEVNWDTAGIVFKPLSELDPVQLATYEHDFDEIARRGPK